MELEFCPSSGKLQYETRSLAQAARVGRVKRGHLKSNFTGLKLEVYKCPDCGLWHLGNTKVRK